MVESITTTDFVSRRTTPSISTTCFLDNKDTACLLSRKPIDPLVFVSRFEDVAIATTSFVTLTNRSAIVTKSNWALFFLFFSIFENAVVAFRYCY
jgi:hypothetical protein